MAGAMRKAMVYLGLVEDEDRYYDDYDEMTGTDGEPQRSSGSRSLAPLREDARGSVATMTERRPHVGAASSVRSFDRITTIHPRTYNEAKQIGESFRESTPVIMNLSDMDDSDAKRLVDFAAGLIFAVHGSIDRVTAKVFLLSPANVEVATPEKIRVPERGFFNQS